MLYQLKNGNTVDLSVEVFLNKTDQDLRDLEGSGWGFELSDPFFNSITTSKSIVTEAELQSMDFEREPDLCELSAGDKLIELDMAGEQAA
jgi:hypothetical protein